VGAGVPDRDHRPGGLVPMTPSRTSRYRPKVLLVEDSAETRRALREFLEAQGITIVGEAADGATGIELAKELMPDVVLMDVKMPGMGGIEATEIITSSLPDAHVIVLTTFDDEVLRRQADEAGATAYLVKGSSPHVIADAIFRVLGP
jgi:NarL family two-component system response regulator LiaR